MVRSANLASPQLPPPAPRLRCRPPGGVPGGVTGPWRPLVVGQTARTCHANSDKVKELEIGCCNTYEGECLVGRETGSRVT